MKKVTLLSFLCWLCSCIHEGDVPPEVLDQWVYFTTSHGLVDDQVTSLYEDDQGNMWIGTTAGLSVFNGSSFTNYTTDDGLLSNEINSIIQDRDGTMWVATSNGINVLIDDIWYYLIVFGGMKRTHLQKLLSRISSLELWVKGCIVMTCLRMKYTGFMLMQRVHLVIFRTPYSEIPRILFGWAQMTG